MLEFENSNFNENFEKTFFKLSADKKKEIKRLIIEISKIKNVNPAEFLNSLETANLLKPRQFPILKKLLLAERYPQSFGKVNLNSFYLPQYNIDRSLEVNTATRFFYPKNIYYESEVKNSLVFENVQKSFPKSAWTEIDLLKTFLKDKKFSIENYNNRLDNLFLIKERYDFFKFCPCSVAVKNCGYSLINLGMGCPYECSYCFLQNYQNIPGISINCNIDDFLKDEKVIGRTNSLFDYKRIGSGEWMDSLALDEITQISKQAINYFKGKKDIFFEFKTKSVNIKNLLEADASPNIVVSWSINSIRIARENEFKSATISERILAAKQCAQAGFSVGFHFDPLVYYLHWKQDYKEIVDMIFDIVPTHSIKWISLGSLRMPFALKKIIENRFPSNTILDGELLLGDDNKLRYMPEIRIEMYKFLNDCIGSKKTKVAVYLCMENAEIWQKSEVLL